MEHIDIDGQPVEHEWIPAQHENRPVVVLLHEGLGCAAMWRDWPQRVAHATGCAVLNYSRPGYGGSSGSLAGRNIDYLEHAAQTHLPAVLNTFGLDDIVLFGHSDGATIALLSAAKPTVTIRGMVLEAPHVFVEEVTLAGIREAGEAYARTDIRDRLARYHGERVDEVFHAWHDVWLSDAFRHWNVEDQLPGIRAPILLIQGEDDQYGTRTQLDSIERNTAADVTTYLLPECGHVPHRDQPDRVLELTGRFIDSWPDVRSDRRPRCNQ